MYFIFLDDDEHEWIVRTCRKGWDEIVGYRENPAEKYIKGSTEDNISNTVSPTS